MEPLRGSVASLFLGDTGTLNKAAQDSLEFAFDGIVGDRHRVSPAKPGSRLTNNPAAPSGAMSGSGPP